jgi:hypothetical protein
MAEKRKIRMPGRGRIRTGLTLLVAIVIAVGVAFIVLTKSRLVPYQVSKYVNEHLLEDTRFEFACGSIEGDLVNRVVLRDPVVRYHADDASYNVFRADEIEIDYSLTGVLRLNMEVQDLRLRNVHLQIRQDADGRIVLPVPVKSEKVLRDDAFAPRVNVRQYAVEGLRLSFGGEERELAVEEVYLSGSYRLERGTGRLLVNRGRAFIPGTQTKVRSVELEAFHEGQSIRVQDFSVRLGSSFVMANGRFEDGRFRRMQFIFNPVVLEELHELGLVPALSGELGGNVVLDGDFDNLALDGTVTGNGFGFMMNNLKFGAKIGSDEVVIDRLEGEVFGAKLDGSFRYNWRRKGSFVYDGKFRGLDLANGYIPEAGLPGMNLNGEGSLVYDGADRYTISAELDSAGIDTYSAGSGLFEAVWDNTRGLAIESFRFNRPGYTIGGSGTITPAGDTEILFTASGSDLGYFWQYASIPPVSGRVSVGGIVTGRYGNLRVNLNGTAEDTGFLFASIDSASVQAEVTGVSGDSAVARVDLSGDTLRLGGRPFTTPHLRLEAGSGSAYVRDFSFARGDSFATMDFEVSQVDAGTSIRFKHISVEVGGTGSSWRILRPVTLVSGDGEMVLDSLEFVSGSERIGMAGSYSEASGTLDVTGWAQQFDLSLLHEALELPIALEGKGDVRFGIRGSIEDPDVDLTAEISDGVVDSTAFDALVLDAGYTAGQWRMNRLRLVTGTDSLAASGRWDFGISPVTLMAGRAGIESGRERPFQVELDCVQYPVPEIMRTIHARADVNGSFTGRVSAHGLLDDPTIRVEGIVEPEGDADTEVTVEEDYYLSQSTGGLLELPTVFIRARHERGAVHLEDITVGGGLNATISGYLPAGLSLIEGVRLRRDDSLLVDIGFDSENIGPLSVYTTRLSALEGELRGNVRIAGTIASPDFGGGLQFDNCLIRFSELDETYTDIDADFLFDGKAVKLTSIRGRSRGEQAFSGTGRMLFDGFVPVDYSLDVAFTDFWIERKPDFLAVVEGGLNVSTFDDADRRIPNITGGLTVRQAEILYTFESSGARRSTIMMPTAAPGWLCTIDLDIHKNLWARNPDMNVELAGQLILKRDHSGLHLRGDLSALRGWYTVYNNKFEVLDGTLDFSAAEGFRPEIFINAYTPYRVENDRESRIYLTLTWPRDKIEPEIKLSSDQPGYYESDLWRMLGGQDIAGGLAANTLEKVLNQQMSGMTVYVDRRATSSGTGGDLENEMMIGVGRYLWQDLYLTYRQGLTLTGDQAVEVEYRLRKMIYIRSGIIRHSNPRLLGNVVRSTDEYNLDVKFRWEY